jgi:hypothetical protein
MNSLLNRTIDLLKEVEKNLVMLRGYEDADQVYQLIRKLSLRNSINVRDNQGQVNISSGNSSINANQDISYNTKIGTKKDE